ncbi:MAG TPA: DUF4197 domain-containing protein [Bacteroidia bacterium]|nr:DUF4197 domain-containing protein [Bacteroidia bacterium]
MKKQYVLFLTAAAIGMLAFTHPAQDDKITQGLKEALTVGTKNAVSLASKTDGYYKNPKIKIPFPAEVKDMEKSLRKVGVNKPVDDFVMSMNRAAEGAAKDAAPIFLDAVKKMSVTDGMSLLKGDDNAITKFFKKKTDAQLVQKFTPKIDQSLKTVKATQYWADLAGTYNKLPLVKKQNLDLTSYTTRKAVDGLYTLIADEEKKIRNNPAARVSNVLKDVFGNMLGGG